MKKSKQSKLLPTQNLVNIKEITDGVVVTDDSRYIKIVEVTPINFHMRSVRERNLIISNFISWIKIAPIKFQFKVLSVPADINNYIESLKDDIKNEKNEKCKTLQKDYLKLICNVGLREGVTRRFFVIFEHEPKGVFGNDWNTIVQDLNAATLTLSNFMKQCGNKVIKHEDEDMFLFDLFFLLYNREGDMTSKTRLNSVMMELKENGITEEPNLKSLLCPLFTHIDKDYLVSNRTYIKYYYIPSESYRNIVNAGWLSPIVNAGAGIDIDLYFQKQEKTKIRNNLGRQLRINKANINEVSDTNSNFDDLSDAINSGYYIKNAMSENQDFYYMNTLITISGYSQEEIEYKENFINDFLNSQDMEMRECKYHMANAFKMSMPLCQIEPTIFERSKRNVLTDGIGSTYPFTSFEISDDNGILFGINEQNNSLCIIDLFNSNKYKNANVSILGTSGAGKTFLMQTIALRMRMKGVQTFIIAPLKGHEFKRACKAIGGEYIKISPGSVSSINILEIRPQDKTNDSLIDLDEEYDMIKDDSILAKKLESLRAFFSLLIPDMSYEEKQLVDNALIKTYNKMGITHDNASLIDTTVPQDENKPIYKKMPILGDLLAILKEDGDDRTRRIETMLSRYVNGSVASFNRQTNVNLDNKYVVVDISEFNEELQPVGMFIALDYIYDKVKEDRTKRKTIFIDEAWKLIGAKSNALAANFVLEIFKIIRGYGGSAICATQDINDFFALEDGKFGKGIISNSKTKIILQLESVEAETVKNIFDLSERELMDIIRFERGQGLVITNSNNVQVKFVASMEEEEMITTDRKRLEEIAKKRKMKKETLEDD